MFGDLYSDMLVAGIGMLVWLRIFSAADALQLTWPFAPIDTIVPNRFKSSVQFCLGIILWLPIPVFLAWGYLWLVENNSVTYYTFGSAVLYALYMWIVTCIGIFPLARNGVLGMRIGRWVWLESMAGWLIFGVIFGLLIE